MKGMEVSLGLLADAANNPGGKLNILGVFDTIRARKFPCVHRRLVLICRFEVNAAEGGQTKTFEVIAQDEDANKIGGVTGKMKIPKIEGRMRAHSDLLLEIVGLKFEKPGPYEFVVMVSGETKYTIPLTVEQVK